jgi:lysophospholipid hydrolase
MENGDGIIGTLSAAVTASTSPTLSTTVSATISSTSSLLSSTLSAIVSETTSTTTTAIVAATTSTTTAAVVGLTTAPPPPEPASILWLTLSLVYSAVYLLQRIAFQTTKFATYTLPAWLFTLFSMSLTFTMNFTTLYAVCYFLVGDVGC